jgi:hypothetical protein
VIKSKYLNTISWTVQTSLSNFMTWWKSDLLSDLKTIIQWQTLQSLIDAKSEWATFGALSNEELKMLQASSSKLAASARTDKAGNIIWFNMSEPKLKKELENMLNLYDEKINRMTWGWNKEEIKNSSMWKSWTTYTW